MQIRDFTIIKSAQPIYPDILSEDAENKLIGLFNDVKSKKKELSSLRKEIIVLEQELKNAENKYNEISHLFNIEFETKEIEEIKEECMLGVFNKEDARNWH